jgi:3-oxoadipate enol-lactonase
MPSIERNDIQIYFEDRGKGHPIILGHSFLCSGEMWKPQLEPLSNQYRVINIDLRGHGKSGVNNEPFDLYDLVDDFLFILDHLNIEKAIWAGLSIGGMIALRAAITNEKRIAGLILLDTHAGAETALNKMKYRAMASFTRIFGIRPLVPYIMRLFFCPITRLNRPDLIGEWKTKILSIPITTALQTVYALVKRESIIEKLKQITVPTLVLVGENDKALPPIYSQKIAKTIPHAEIEVIKKAGHLITLEQPEAVNSAILAFLHSLYQEKN